MIVEDSHGDKLNLDDWKKIIIHEFVHPFHLERRSWDVYVEGYFRDPGTYQSLDGTTKEISPSFSLLEKFSTEDGAVNFAKKLPRTTQPIEIHRRIDKKSTIS